MKGFRFPILEKDALVVGFWGLIIFVVPCLGLFKYHIDQIVLFYGLYYSVINRMFNWNLESYVKIQKIDDYVGQVGDLFLQTQKKTKLKISNIDNENVKKFYQGNVYIQDSKKFIHRQKSQELGILLVTLLTTLALFLYKTQSADDPPVQYFGLIPAFFGIANKWHPIFLLKLKHELFLDSNDKNETRQIK